MLKLFKPGSGACLRPYKVFFMQHTKDGFLAGRKSLFSDYYENYVFTSIRKILGLQWIGNSQHAPRSFRYNRKYLALINSMFCLISLSEKVIPCIIWSHHKNWASRKWHTCFDVSAGHVQRRIYHFLWRNFFAFTTSLKHAIYWQEEGIRGESNLVN